MLRMPSILSSPTTKRGTILLGALVAAVPLVGTLAILVVTPSFSRPMSSEAPTLLGIPYVVTFLAFAVTWGAIGGHIVGTARSRWVLPYILLIFTLPACFAVVFAPALAFILQNLG